MARPPVDSPDRSVVETNRQRVAETRRLDEEAPRRCFGMPRGPYTTNQSAHHGDLVLMDPTNAATTLEVRLAKAAVEKNGEKTSVKNYSDSTNPIRVVAEPPDLIDGAPYKEMTGARELATFIQVKGTAWICFRGDGCL